ncbi:MULTISPECIES: Do family serine endopeptidase [unclassified Bradyrhizobium]|uniref:Do family serine endopeptidase n=1 Tax=unclassified Bradyrhizobium TaxID=2631580 RepID=UPI002479A174|nr:MULTISPECIES: Do family serine endopeptidase [unclassified Bradyrhizobium]WGS19651.1 Do family serine endopeptidase [Bradyrhizobium sp. ISRA463]WGS26493.1 Do family serine endopeptidase [Bradyrhizobium sp. ISRA464]
MPDDNNFDDNNKLRHRILPARRLTLLGSVAMIGAALAVAGPLGHGRFVERALAAAPTSQTQGPAGFADLVAKVKPAVISVRVKLDERSDASGPDAENLPPSLKGTPFEKFFRQFGFDGTPGGKLQRHEIITGVGSGFFISADGYAVTNNHVVDHAKSVQVTTDDGTIYTAKVIGTDPKTDLALIKVDGKKDFTYVNLESQVPRVGDWVVAVGNPYGLGGTVTAGIISAEGRDIGAGPYDNYIQIDAPINKGNSGGPTFDTNGNVIGVNTAIYSPSGGSVGIGFDVPAPTVKMIVAQLKEHGSVTRGWLGVQVQPVTKGIAESLGLKQAQGALVDEAQPDTPAAQAGLRPGDVITSVNGNAVKDSRTLAREISAMAPGSSAKLDILRKGETQTVTVTLAKMPNDTRKVARADDSEQGSSKDIPHLGLSVAPAGDVGGAGDKGVVVMAVDPDGPAAEHGLQSGDVILSVGGKSVGSAADLRNALSDAKSDGKHDVLMRVKTSDNTHFVAMPIG